MTRSQVIHFPKGDIHCLRVGHGPRLLVAFHGFGDNAGIFAGMEDLGNRYTVYAVDLPYHGRTGWKEGGYGKADIEAVVDHILQQEGQESFTWLGYSFGGRIILSMMERMAGRLEAVWLVAPDGLGTKGLAFPSMVPLPVRRWCARWLERPAWLLWIARQFHRWKLIDAFSLHFVQYFLTGEKRRRLLLNTWLSLDHFRVIPRQVRRTIAKNAFPVTVVLGDRDDLIPIPAFKKLVKGMKNVDLIIVPETHDTLASGRKLAKIILQYERQQ